LKSCYTKNGSTSEWYGVHALLNVLGGRWCGAAVTIPSLTLYQDGFLAAISAQQQLVLLSSSNK
jgi:hypothetical protein